MSDPLLTSSADGVREMRLNRPEKRNAITYAMYEALYRGLTGAQADETVRVVLLTGEGAAFCAGNDLKDRKSTRLNSSHRCISYAVFCLKKKNKQAHAK